MLKEERLTAIQDLIDQQGLVKVNEIVSILNVSDMTVRRDLTELEKTGRVKRIHGGAKSLNIYKQAELSHSDKQVINMTRRKRLQK